jgi:tRNA/tmRNA/rRNA uracil-C5-methylase (TrmA/RlmC/RlmD family)
MNQLESFIPLMYKHEYEFILKYLNKNDVFLEWGSGNGTLYFSTYVNKLISIEHDVDYYNIMKTAIDAYEIKNIELINVPSVAVTDQKSQRHIAFAEYINYPIKNNLKFNKVLIDGRARKFCAITIADYIDENTIIFIHDFNFNNVEGYDDESYFDDILSIYDIVERLTEGRGIVSLKKKFN